MVSVYIKNMSQGMGRKAVDPRVAVGALIIKHILRATDEDTIEFIKENPYLQYFLGYAEYRYEQPFTSSLFVSIRRRLGIEQLQNLMDEFIAYVRKIEQQVSSKKQKTNSGRKTDTDDSDKGSKNKVHLIVDATVAPSDIKYPTDLDLLNEARKKSEALIDMLYVPEKEKVKPRTYRQKARKEYLSFAKQRKKRKKTLRKALKKQLGYVSRNLKTIEKLLNEKDGKSFPLAHKYQKMYWVIQEVYRQQKQMYDDKTHKTAARIVSISQPYVRPIVRGKSGKEVEFRAKISVSMVDGYVYLDRLNWDAYNEGGDLISQIEYFKERFGYYPEWVSGDKIYGNRENRAYMKKHNIKYTGVALGRRIKEPTHEQKELEKARKNKAKQRSHIEGAFGTGKRKYDLDLVKARTQETSETWIGMVYLVINIARFMRVIFWPLLKKGYIAYEKLKKGIYDWIALSYAGIIRHRLLTF
ncbi:MAG TPA: IS5 family transposase [Gammaproteobacteria bacterium]|nr:IS5 family transposase [Gammaproteobacteria bacterium]